MNESREVWWRSLFIMIYYPYGATKIIAILPYGSLLIFTLICLKSQMKRMDLYPWRFFHVMLWIFEGQNKCIKNVKNEILERKVFWKHHVFGNTVRKYSHQRLLSIIARDLPGLSICRSTCVRWLFTLLPSEQSRSLKKTTDGFWNKTLENLFFHTSGLI